MSSRPRRPHRLRRRLALLFCAAVVGLVLAELAARLFFDPPQGGGAAAMVVPDSEVGFRLRPDYRGEQAIGGARAIVELNARGYRSPDLAEKRPGEHRVLLLGDSFAFGHCVPVDEAFPQRLETLLRADGRDVHVVNTGAPGYTTYHEYHLLLEDGPTIRPDEVVLAFYLGNDFRGNHTNRFGKLVARGDGLIREMPDDGAAERLGQWLVANSRLAQVGVRAFATTGVSVAPEEDVIALACDNADWDVGFSLAMARHEWDSDAQEAWQMTLHWLTAIRDHCTAENLPFKLVLLPGPQQYSEVVWGLAVQHCGLDPRDYELAKPNRMLVEWAAGNDVPVVDLLPAFRAKNDDQNHRLYIDCHFSSIGHDLAAREIARGLFR